MQNLRCFRSRGSPIEGGAETGQLNLDGHAPLTRVIVVDDLLFAELLQITPIHADMDSEFLKLGKWRGNARGSISAQNGRG